MDDTQIEMLPMLDVYKRQAHGIFKRSIVFLEHEAVPGSSNKYDTASFHILSFGQEGIPEGYH